MFSFTPGRAEDRDENQPKKSCPETDSDVHRTRKEGARAMEGEAHAQARALEDRELHEDRPSSGGEDTGIDCATISQVKQVAVQFGCEGGAFSFSCEAASC